MLTWQPDQLHKYSFVAPVLEYVLDSVHVRGNNVSFDDKWLPCERARETICEMSVY